MDKNWKPTHRHLKRGSEYQHVATATLQCSMPLSDMQSMEVYCDKDECLRNAFKLWKDNFRSCGKFKYWLYSTHNIDFETDSFDNVKFVGSDEDITMFVLKFG